MSDLVQIALITTTPPTLVALFAYLQTLKTDKKVAAVAVVAEKIHTLSNSGFGENLQLGMVSAETLALTSGKPEHIELAKVAREKYDRHMAQQAKVDAGVKTP